MLTRAEAQRRTIGVLFISSVFAHGGRTIGFAVAVLLLEEMMGSTRWAGLSTVALTLGTVISAGWISSYMDRRGRRPGLVVAYVLASIGGAIALTGAQVGSVIAFLFGLVLIGIGGGASNLARYAAADLAEPERKANAIGFIVFAASFGAVGGPVLVGLTDDLGQRYGLDPNVGPNGVTVVFLAIGALIVWAGLRPDPLIASRTTYAPDDVQAASPERAASRFGAGLIESFRVIASVPVARLAFVALVVAQAVMVGVMAMTPLHMDAHGHDVSVIGLVISAHTAGMFAFAPLAGWLSDRLGRVRVIALGGFTLVVATALTALAGEAPAALMFPGLYLLGLGWSFAMVAGSALLAESVPADDRVGVQGAAELCAGVVAGSAALASGLVLSMAGFHILSMIGIVASGLLLVAAYAHDRRIALANS